VAFAIGVQQLPVHECLKEFHRLAKTAFTKRLCADWGILGHIVTAIYGSKYRSEGLEKALKTTFGNEELFGPRVSVERQSTVRVGVVACTASGHTPVIMANYNRAQGDYGKSLISVFF
jgi:hypothetical protein